MCGFLCVVQTARWKVTSKEALQRIGEYSEAAITIRGTYFPPGKEPKEGERKIYLAIESERPRLAVSVLIQAVGSVHSGWKLVFFFFLPHVAM